MATIGQKKAAKAAKQAVTGTMQTRNKARRDALRSGESTYNVGGVVRSTSNTDVYDKGQVISGSSSGKLNSGSYKKQSDGSYQSGTTNVVLSKNAKPKVSTTTLSNYNKIKQIPSLNTKLDEFSNKGISTDPETGTATYADGSLYEDVAPPTKSNTKSEDPFDTSYEDQQAEYLMESMKKTVDAQTKAQIDSIQQKFQTRKTQQEKVNKSAEAGTQNALIMAGSSQYAPISSGGIMQAQMTYGVQQLANLDSQEQDLIAEAKLAQSEQNFRLMEKKLAEVEQKRKEKVEAGIELNKQLAKENAEFEKQSAITDVYNLGITDTASAMAALNKMGVKANVKEVADTIGLLSGIGGSGIVGEYNFYASQARAAGQVPMSFNSYQDVDANRKKSIAKAGVGGSGGYSKDQEKAIDQINTSVQNNDTYKKYNSMKSSANNVEVALGQSTGLGDIAAINQFQKVIDEGAVTRDQDVQLIQGAQSLANSLKTKMKKLEKGEQLSSEQRQQMLEIIRKMVDAQKKAVDNDKGIAAQRKKAARFGVSEDETILGENSVDGDMDIEQQGEQAKQEVDDFYLTTDKGTQKSIDGLYNQGWGDVEVVEWLKLRNFINK